MERGRSREIELLQPYMPLKTTNFEKIVVKQYGISHFYEFKICENHKKQLQAVPDGSVDLLESFRNQVDLSTSTHHCYQL